MMKRTWLRSALSVAALMQSSGSGAATSHSWSPVIKGPLAKNIVYCTIFRGFANGSVLTLQVNRQTTRSGMLIVKLFNTNWSISAGTALPELAFRDAQGSGLDGVPEATQHGLLFHIPIGPMIEWSDTLKGESFLLMRGGEPLAQFDSVGLAQSIRNVRACGQSI